MGTTAATGDGDATATVLLFGGRHCGKWLQVVWRATRLHVALMIWREMQNTDGFGNYGRIDSRVNVS